MRAKLLLISVMTFATASLAEPRFCQSVTTENLLESEQINAYGSNPKRAKILNLGGTFLAGSAVGNSSVNSEQSLAISMLNYFLRPGPLLQSLNEHMWHNAEKSCTWYHNEGEEAQDFFRHFYVVNPKKMNKPSGEYEDFAGTFTSLFDPSSERFQVSAYIHCLKNYRFVSLGCNGQKHRGPTVFAMILAYAGCDPKKMADFVNQVWGLNGVREESRLNLVRRAYEMGRQEVVKSDELAKLFSREYPDPQSMDAIRNGPILCQLFRRQGEENVTFASLCGAGLSSLKIDRAYRPWLQYEDYLRKR